MLYDKPFVSLPLNNRGRDFFIGDLHGCMSMLRRLLDFVAFDPANDRLISVGDLIDRGPHSVEALLAVREEQWFHAIRGNHEAMMIAATQPDLPRSYIRYPPPALWYENGGGWFREKRDPEILERILPVPGRLPLALEVPLSDGRLVGVVHGSLSLPHSWAEVREIEDDGAPLDDSERTLLSKLMWSRTSHVIMNHAYCSPPYRVPMSLSLIDRYLLWRAIQPLPGVDLLISGHTPLDAGIPLQGNGRLLIDTGAGHPWGHLTMVELPSGRYWQVADPSRNPGLDVTEHAAIEEVDLSGIVMSAVDLAGAERCWYAGHPPKDPTD